MVASQFAQPHPICTNTPSLFPISIKPTLISLSSPWLTGPSSLGPLRFRLVPKSSSTCTHITINQGIAVVALLRHFGCPCCWESKARFDSATDKLIAGGVGSVSKARILADRSRSQSVQYPAEAKLSRRHLCGVTSLLTILTFNHSILLKPVRAEDKVDDQEKDDGIIGSVKSLFDPNETTKSGKVLPKAYLKSAREVVKKLRESLQEDRKDMAKFRRTADAAKESIRDYLSNWRGQQTVTKEESYVVLEKAFRSLANFYAKAGPSASLSDDVKSEILHDLDRAELFL